MKIIMNSTQKVMSRYDRYFTILNYVWWGGVMLGCFVAMYLEKDIPSAFIGFLIATGVVDILRRIDE